MQRRIDDVDYMECLPSLYRKSYITWKARMLTQVDAIAQDLNGMQPEEVMTKYNLTPRDVALLVRLQYLTAEEVEKYGLRRIEGTVPV